MDQWLTKFKMLGISPTGATIGAALGGAISSFFHVPIFYALIILVFFDFITGIHKARTLKRVRSAKFSKAFERLVAYLYLYIPLHAFSLALPPGFDLFDDLILGIFLTRELLSIVENYKVITVATGKNAPIVDWLIHYIGADLPKLLEEALPHPREEEKPDAPANR